MTVFDKMHEFSSDLGTTDLVSVASLTDDEFSARVVERMQNTEEIERLVAPSAMLLLTYQIRPTH